MESTSVRTINAAIYQQAMKGKPIVKTADGYRVFRARTQKGQLQAKLASGKWVDVGNIIID